MDNQAGLCCVRLINVRNRNIMSWGSNLSWQTEVSVSNFLLNVGVAFYQTIRRHLQLYSDFQCCISVSVQDITLTVLPILFFLKFN